MTSTINMEFLWLFSTRKTLFFSNQKSLGSMTFPVEIDMSSWTIKRFTTNICVSMSKFKHFACVPTMYEAIQFIFTSFFPLSSRHSIF